LEPKGRPFRANSDIVLIGAHKTCHNLVRLFLIAFPPLCERSGARDGSLNARLVAATVACCTGIPARPTVGGAGISVLQSATTAAATCHWVL
jgi:hypothetical protein